jgi:F420-dependent oxidoreductase-like protein
VRFTIFTEPQQGARYGDLLAVAQRAERLGFDGFFRSDHYLAMGDHFSGLPGPSDAWVTLSGLARDTSTIRLGTLVSPVTFRSPGVLAISVANVDDMSGGRVELGLGAGWFEAEHSAYAIDFPPLGERFTMLEEQLQIVTGLWSTPVGSRFEFAGKHHSVSDSPALPKPVQSPIPLIIGGGGARRTPMLAARHATEYNLPFQTIERYTEQVGRVKAACAEIGRDPDDIVYSVALVVCIGSDGSEIARRASAIGRDSDEMRANGLCGTPTEAVERLAQWRDAGVERVHLQTLDLTDLEHLDLIATEVIPHL